MSQQPISSENRRTRVLVAYEPGEVQTELLKLVKGLGYATFESADGNEAFRSLAEHAPQLMVVDAGIGGRASFELCDFIKREELDTKVILVASVYRKTRYKRRPTSLYGADDYVEQHHIHDLLPRKMAALLGGSGRWDAERFVDKELVRRFGDKRLELASAEGPHALEAARRLAWIIVSDVALYNPELLRVPEDRYSATTRIDLAEGRRLFAEMVPSELGDTEDFVADALNRLRAGQP
jgi:CheY-like chemotaxis protein